MPASSDERTHASGTLLRRYAAPVSGKELGKELGKRALHRLFTAGQRVGVDVLPRHFYSAVPDLHVLRTSTQWRTPRTMTGIRGHEVDGQERALAALFTPEVTRVLRARDVYAEACAANGAVGFGPIEAQVLYAFVATHRPARVVQVGAGVSTAIVLAASRDAAIDVPVTCVDPFPTAYLRDLAARGEIRLLARPAQEVALADLDVGAGGLLFVDSTHTVKPGSEVNRLVLDVLPQLPAGAWAHFHDVTFPYDYPPELLHQTLFFWNETALLLAYLADNPRAAIEISLSMLHDARPDAIARHLPGYRPARHDRGLQVGPGHFPSSTYLRFGPAADPSAR
jgi:hypothetical protein